VCGGPIGRTRTGRIITRKHDASDEGFHGNRLRLVAGHCEDVAMVVVKFKGISNKPGLSSDFS